MWHSKPITVIIKELSTSETKGLPAKEIEKRLARDGLNTFPEKKKTPLILKFIDQFKDLMIIILLISTVISFLLGDILDAVAIAAIVLINATIGFIQEIKAEKTLDSLKRKDVSYCLVLREKRVEKIPVSLLVAGDILILEEGEKVPADARIIESFALRVDESILTGESQAASKNSAVLNLKASLADRKNMIFKDTTIMAGRGKAVVVATGISTEIGKIALYLQTAQSPATPLSLQLNRVGRMLTYVIGIIAVLIFSVNIYKSVPLVESLLGSISLAVAAIPEGLPAIVTIVLSLGVKKMADKKAIVRKLAASETLGAIKYIATDKTGTLTQNKINVVKIITPDNKSALVEGEGYHPEGVFLDTKEKVINPSQIHSLLHLIKVGILTSNAQISMADEKEPAILGDTTEGALLVLGQRASLNIDNVRNTDKKVFEIPFTSERKMMSVIVEMADTKDYFLFSKGAPEIIFSLCRLNEKEKIALLKTVASLATDGLRSLAFAGRKLTKTEVKQALEEETVKENNLEYMGLMGMQDPLRAEVRKAIADAKNAGIRTIMITGDHVETARAIAIKAGIINKGGQIATDEEVNKISQRDLAAKIHKGLSVFARISPMGKLKIVEAIKSLPFTQVAVTGDGVNDAPALRASDIGVAMGNTGTDLTREVADIVITDDNYATIVDAIKEGRVIYANLIKFIRFLISCNLSEVIIVAVAVIAQLPVPLLPIQLLWINLITDGMPALALGLEPAEHDVMNRPPRDTSEGILHKKRWIYMLIEGSIMGFAVLSLYLFAVINFPYPVAQTMAFTSLTLAQLVHAFNNKSVRRSLFQTGVTNNMSLVFAVLLSLSLQILAVQSVTGNLIFKTVHMNLTQWILVSSVALLPFFVVELKKQLRFRILP